MKKRGIIMGDTHCGHLCGLTPPAWMTHENRGDKTKMSKWARLQRQLWSEYKRQLERFGPFNFGLFTGDAIDGKGERSGGSELITADRDSQVDMAVAVVDQVRLHAKRRFKWVGVMGTAYHTGVGEDFENTFAKDAGFSKIGSHEWPEVNGCIFDLKHHIGTSSIPHGRYTAIAKDKLWNTMWAERELQPKAKVLLRGHSHYHAFCGGPGWLAMTVPALQGMGTKYGARRCSGLVDWGFVVIDVDTDGSFDWHAETVELSCQKTETVIL